MTGESADSLLTLCPRCTYALEGLPVEHRCPECGLDLDRRWRVFGGRSMRKAQVGSTALRWFLTGLMIWQLVLVTIISFSVGKRPPPLLAVVVFVFGAAFMYWFVGRTPRKFIALSHDELLIYHGRGRFERHPWRSVGRARYEHGLKRIRIDVGEGKVTISLQSLCGLNIMESDRCIRAINDHPRAA